MGNTKSWTLKVGQTESYSVETDVFSGHRTDDGGEQTNHADGDDETGPAVPVVCGRDEGEQNFPEDGEEMHDVVEAGRQLLFAALLVVVIFTWRRRVEGSDLVTMFMQKFKRLLNWQMI